MFKTLLANVAVSLLLTSAVHAADATNNASDPAAVTAPAVYPSGPGRGSSVHTPPPPRPSPLPPFYDPKLPVQKRVEDLVSRLSLEEKV